MLPWGLPGHHAPALATYTPNSAFLVKPIFNRFPQRHYQELPPNHNSPLTRTFSTILSFEDSSTLFPLPLTLPHSHPKGTCSFKRPQCSSLRQNYLQRTSCHLFFLHVNLPTTISLIKVHCISNSPKFSSTPSTPSPWEQSQATHEPICQ